jgi:hypothetical protein
LPTVAQAASYYASLVKKGKGNLHTGHCFVAEEEEAKRIAGAPNVDGKPKTKIAFDSADPESYKEWHKEAKRWLEMAEGNPTLRADMMIVALKAYSEEAMKVIRDTLCEQRAQQTANSGLPRAVIPDMEDVPSWLKT